MPDVSVIIPTYNRLTYLKQAIASCFEGNEDIEVEVLVVDDGSSDGTREWLSQLANSRVRVILQNNSGAPAARNAGLRAAQANLIKFLDDDDWLVPNSLSAQVKYMNTLSKDNEKISIYSDHNKVNEVGEYFGQEVKRGTFQNQLDQISFVISKPEHFQTSLLLHLRKNLLEICGFEESLLRGQEADLHLRLSLNGVRFIKLEKIVSSNIRDHYTIERIGIKYHDSILSSEFIINEFGRLIQVVHDKYEVLPKQVKDALALRAWNYGKTLYRKGDKKNGKLLFDYSTELASNNILCSSNIVYKITARLFGFEGAEITRMFGKKLIQPLPLRKT